MQAHTHCRRQWFHWQTTHTVVHSEWNGSAHIKQDQKVVSGAQTFYWSTESNLIDDACLEGVDAIINLAGDGIVDRPWSDKRKTEIYNSRINATKLLFDLVYKHKNQVTAYIGASAIGVYPEGINLTENTLPADTFLAKLCHQWELEH